jgi:hypothetical protein
MLEISFCRIYFLIFLKMTKIYKKICIMQRAGHFVKPTRSLACPVQSSPGAERTKRPDATRLRLRLANRRFFTRFLRNASTTSTRLTRRTCVPARGRLGPLSLRALSTRTPNQLHRAAARRLHGLVRPA